MMNIVNSFIDYQGKLNKSKRTLDSYKDECRLFVERYVQKHEDFKKLENTDFLINTWLVDMMKQYAPQTVNKKKIALSTFSNYLVMQNIISENKIKQVEKVENDVKKIDIYTDEEEEKMLSYLENKIKENKFQRKIDREVFIMQRCIIHLLMTSAMRISEVIKMKIEDINLDETNTFSIRGKGYNNKVSRKNSFNETVAKELREYLEIRRRIQIAEGDEEFLFVSPLSKKHITEKSVRKFVKKMQDDLGIVGTIHEFRHTKCSKLIEKGVDVEKVALYAGHANSNTTKRYYIKSTESELEEMANL